MSEHVAQSGGGPEIRDIARFKPAIRILVVFGAVVLLLAVILGYAMSEKSRLGLAYLVGYAAWLTPSLGALFFVVIQHLTRAGWSVTVRRLAEVMAANIVTMIILAIPLLIFAFTTHMYHGMHPGDDAILQSKYAWLNGWAWAFRVLIYLAIWWALAHYHWRKSLLQDRTGETVITSQLQAKAGLWTAVFALTMMFGAIDLLMTTAPHWYSTMFGVIIFAGAFLSFFAIAILIFRFLQSRGIVTESVTVEHYHDMGKFMFAFVFFWSYVSFSQYMLIWYGNIPEETMWLAKRGATTDDTWSAGPWGIVALGLLLFHWLVPMAGLLSRWAKRILGLLTMWSVWIVALHFVDLFWVVMPEADGSPEDAHVGLSLLLALLCWAGVGAIWLAGLIRIASAGSLICEKDPRMHEALSYEVY